MRPIVLLSLRRPWAVIAVIVAVTALAALHLPRLTIDNRTENILPADSSEVQDYERFRRQFGTDEVLLVGFAPGDPAARVVDPVPFAQLAELGGLIAGVAEIDSSSVISIANARVPRVRQTPRGPDVTIEPLASPPPTDAASADALAERIARLPLLRGLLVSDDLRTAAIVCTLRPPDDPSQAQELQIRAVNEVRRRTEAFVAAAPEGARPEIHLAGVPVTKSAFVTLLARDMLLFVPISAGLIGLVLLALFRSWRGVLLPLVTVGLATLWVVSLMAELGYSINTVTGLLPPLLVAVGVGDVVHIYTAFLGAYARRPDAPTAALEEALEETFGACLLTSVTTAVGFGSLMVSPIGPIREAGGFAALGVMFAFVISVTLVPAALRLSPGRPGAPGESDGEGDGACARSPTAAAAAAVGRAVVDRPVAALVGSGLLCGLLAFGAARWLQVEVDFLRYFKKEHELSRAVDFFAERLAGPLPLEIVVQGPPGAFIEPRPLRRLAEYQARLEAMRITDHTGAISEPIDRTISVADFVKAAGELQLGRYEIPEDPVVIATWSFYANLADGELGLEPIISRDASTARVSARVGNVGSQESAAMVAEAERLFDEVFGSGDTERYRLTVTGGSVIFLGVTSTITRSTIESFGLALAFVFVCIVVLFRSLRLGLLSLPPNVFPIVVIFGLMAYAGMTLNMNTAMVASIAIGIAVDDTIHFLAGFRRQMARLGDPREATIETCRRVGAACGATTLILACGFGVAVLASFYPVIHFGALSAAAIVAAFFGDFVILPALITVTWRISRP